MLFHVGLVTAATFHTADFAWVPSYFDDDDGDFLPLLLSEQMPALVDPGRGWAPALIVLSAIVAWRPRADPGSPRRAFASGLPPVRSLLSTQCSRAARRPHGGGLSIRGGCTCSDSALRS